MLQLRVCTTDVLYIEASKHSNCSKLFDTGMRIRQSLHALLKKGRRSLDMP